MATLKDVARESGLAVATVSRVLNNRGYISDEARNKVEQAMKKLNYSPNEVARSLHHNKSRIIGLIVPHITHPFFSAMIEAVEKEAYQRGFRVLIFNTRALDENEREFLDICSSHRVAGIIMFTGNVSLKQFRNSGIPVITIERYLEEGTASIECDNELGGHLAAEHLISKGCRKILHFGSNPDFLMPADSRYHGFLQSCMQHQVETIEIVSAPESFQRLDYYQEIEKALMEHRDADGAFANNDIIGSQLIQVCRKLGIRVPQDLKIVGFDDTLPAKIAAPPLTTIHQPIGEMAELAVRLLGDAVQGKLVPIRTQLPVSLVEREST